MAFAEDGQAIGVGAGQQSRIHCTRLAAQKADLWHLRQHDKVLSLQFAEGVGRPEKNNIIDIYLSDECEDVIGEDVWRKYFAVRPEEFTREEKRAYLDTLTGVSLGSDAFFPFDDNIVRAAKSGVSYGRRARRLRARRYSHRHLRPSRHRDGIHRDASFPSLR